MSFNTDQFQNKIIFNEEDPALQGVNYLRILMANDLVYNQRASP